MPEDEARGETGPRWRGGCHCGAVRFAVDGAIGEVVECNCSICTKKGFLHWIVSADRFRLETPREALSVYRFGTGVAQHLFCATCGIASFYVPRSHPDGVDVNVRCLDGVDLAALRIVPFDGRRWDEAIGALRTR